MSNQLIVAKFGGTSVADFQAMSRCADIVLADPAIRLVAVSASSGVTNLLVDITKQTEVQARYSSFEGIERITLAVLNALQQPETVAAQINSLLADLRNLIETGGAVYSGADKDLIQSFGERLSSVLFTQVLAERGAAAQCFDVRLVLRTDSRFGKGEPQISVISDLAQTHLLPLLRENIVVTQGFIGADEAGQTTTLGRGGSDYSAALLGEALNAVTVQIWTDVVGIFTTDPRLTSEARCINEISFDEAAEMATFGAKVLHPATLIPAMRRNIKVFVGSSREPEAGGTWIAKTVEHKPAYRAIALRKSQTLITVKSPEMLHAAGFLARVFDILSRHQISVDLVTTSEISVALTLDESAGSAFHSAIEPALEELKSFCEVSVEQGLSLVAVIGNHLHSTKGVTGELFSALEQINMRLICHGASRHNLCFLVQDASAAAVVKDLHQKLFN
ncbi:MAG: lysine-sensitive aspartokinase 3 [Gammaproteobacteria bacterium]|nr:lysine-sensitive aspartokinase 3 [Gammaproteobacteria bacterium]MBU2057748.1 lysine-sensitive aspartokinase 3 [Gammaproteobacteria bacterium]MBU2174712.1 lysine-sensitive aspartokinase 3 [Gammaproteobacteria bacterium]MBU2248969.1 lysine-sensitive aspartokinase 3 [Gammaproteobacteria bacterium]MBU2345179.1 lysine-sensitive aspartokinase 3 [Gammaproteobacteria bacterium]